MALKNQALNVNLWALNIETNLGQSGLAPTMQLKGVGDGTEYNLGVSANEIDANLLPGMYSVNLPASATNYNFISIGGISTNPDVVIVPISFATERGYLSSLQLTSDAISAAIGTPITLDGGLPTLSVMLTKMSDDNGGASFDATTDSLNAIKTAVVAGVPTYVYAWSGTVVSGTTITGSYSSTYLDNGAYWNTRPNGTNVLDQIMYFQLGTKSPSSVFINGRYTAAVSRYVNIFAWNYVTSAWDQISDSTTRMNHSTTDINYEYILNVNQVDATSAGNAQIRFMSSNATATYNLFLDLVTIKAVAAGATSTEIANAVYLKMKNTIYNDGIWIDTINGYAGTDIGINGMSTYPVNNLPDAITLANALGVQRFYLKPDSTISLSQNFDNWRFVGKGNINLNGQSIADAIFEGCELISGTSVGQDADFNSCTIGTCTMDSCSIHDGKFIGTFTSVASGAYTFHGCIDGIPSTSNPTIVCQNSAYFGLRDWRGGINIDSLGPTNQFTIDGQVRLVITSSCTGGSIIIRGCSDLVDQVVGGFAGTITDTARWNESQNIANVTSNVSGSVDHVIKSTSVSAYENFPQVYVSANGDKTGYYLANSVTVSAYTDFPQVAVSANFDKTNYTVSSGTINTVTGNVNGSVGSVPDVQVSGINTLVIDTIQDNLASASQVDNIQTTVDAISSVTNQFVFSGTAVEAYSVNELVMPGAVTVSAYTNFPSVNVSSVDSGAITSADYNVDFYDRTQLGLATSTSISNVQTTVDAISANTNTLVTTPLSANIVWVNGVAVEMIDFKNTSTEMYDAAASAMDIELTSNEIATVTNLASMSAGIINQGNEYWAASASTDEVSAGCVLAINNKFTFSGDAVIAYGTSAHINTQEVVDAMLATVVDTKTFTEVLEILIAMATGKITRVNNKFTYYKQDNTTELYTLESARAGRTRL